MASPTIEDYLERIYELIRTKGYARPVEIAESLEKAQPSVTKMLQRLHEQGFVVYAKYRGLVLTEAGENLARSVKFRHDTLMRLLNMLGLDGDQTLVDVEGIEHHVSTATIDRLSDFVSFLEARPDILQDFASRGGSHTSPPPLADRPTRTPPTKP